MAKNKKEVKNIHPNGIGVNLSIFVVSFIMLFLPSFLEEHAFICIIVVFSNILSLAQVVKSFIGKQDAKSSKTAENPHRGALILLLSAAGVSMIFWLILFLLKPVIRPLYGRLCLLYFFSAFAFGLGAFYCIVLSCKYKKNLSYSQKPSPNRKYKKCRSQPPEPASAKNVRSARVSQGVSSEEVNELLKQYKIEKGLIDCEDHTLDKDKFAILRHDLGDQETLYLEAMRTETLPEWNRQKKRFTPLISKPGFEDVAAHYNELKKLDRKWSEMGLNRFSHGFDQEYPVDYEHGKTYIDLFLSFGPRLTFYRDASGKARLKEVFDEEQLFEKLNRYINHENNGIYEYAWCDFAYGYEKNEYDCFADSGVLFAFDIFNSAKTFVLLTNEEFYDVVKRKVLEHYSDYCKASNNPQRTKKRIDDLLLKLQDSTKSNYAKESQSKDEHIRLYDDYYYVKNTEDTAAIVQYIGQNEVDQIPTVLDGLPVSGIASYAFSYEDMTRLTVPKGIRVIGEWMPLKPFYSCKISDELILPAGIIIKWSAFQNSSLPKTVVIPEGAVLEGDCFSCCEMVEALFVGPHATLKERAFSNSKDLCTVVCASGSSITDEAFDGCERLEKVVLCGNVELGKKVFRDAEGIKIIKARGEEYAQALETALRK